MKSNRLLHEKSPYLLQHAHNPVDWYPWGNEAFEMAKKLDKPIFLSIGYSTCHWCHVMEHESFEDEDVATLLNDVFISIKVDREERPDIDNVYMTVAQMITGRGGWPLTIIMTPDKKPFYASTYIPKESRFGIVGMMDLIPRIKSLWETRRDELLESADKVTKALESAGTHPGGGMLDESILTSAFEELKESFDEEHGGFATAPKFPTPHYIVFLLRYWKRTGDTHALHMVEKTLLAMSNGGINDHIGGGFHRYSTDREWMVPHFEKMLYDQALISMAYTEAYQATKNKVYELNARRILDYVIRDMKANDGGFFSAEDADSEGEEGKFYLWTESQIKSLLDEKQAEVVVEIFGIEGEGNFEDEATSRKTGKNIFHREESLKEIASRLELSEEQVDLLLNEAIEILFANREERVHPHRDDKILTDWNGLMIASLAKASKVFHDENYLEAAVDAARFILQKMKTEDGRLLHRYRDGETLIQANIDDYAFMVWGLIELYEATFDPYYLTEALELNDIIILHFWDKDGGGFYFTADDGEVLLVRTKEFYDSAIPSGNSIAMMNLLRLARMTGNTELENRAMLIGKTVSGSIKRVPKAFTVLLSALDFGLGPAYEVVLVGNKDGRDSEHMISSLYREFLPNKVVIFKDTSRDVSSLDTISPFTKGLKSIDGNLTAYVCESYACKLPTTDIEKMLELLGVH
ncbi:MAG: thioredoxin domain-containing protein [Spirochaetota bacterium]|nr:MAG: thioredoxin domain-containing protein [Spirochaetota bacterium]